MYFILSLRHLFKTFLISINIQQVMLKVHTETRTGLHVRCPILLCSFHENCNVTTDFNKSSPVRNFMKIHSSILELLRANGETDVAELVGACFETLLLADTQERKRMLVTPYRF